MRSAAGRLPHVLAEDEPCHDFGLAYLDSNEVKRLARQWGCKEAAKLRKDPCVAYLAGAFKDPARVRERWNALRDDHKIVLSVFKRYGGTVSGEVLARELLARRVVREPRQGENAWQRADPVESLRRDHLLVAQRGSGHWSSSSWRLSYPYLAAHPGLVALAEAAAPLSWKASRASEAPASIESRTPAEVALDLARVSEALAGMGEWKGLSGGSLSTSQRARLAKSVPIPQAGVVPVPEVACLYYEVLRGAGAIEGRGSIGRLVQEKSRRLLAGTSSQQGRAWTRAWIETSLWQDGIGVVPDRDNYQEPVRIEPDKLRTSREMLAWALTRVAHGGGEWLDLDVFARDLWNAAGEHGIDFYWGRFAWAPDFPAAHGKDSIPAGDARSFAYWLDREGGWVANALFGTLFHLGFVERGTYVRKKAPRCFRLTSLGRVVFGAPEATGEGLPRGRRFLTVQPNQEVVAYLDEADAGEVATLTRIAEPTSAQDGAARTFRFTRGSVYAALEGGLRPEGIRAFLELHSRTGIPMEVESAFADSSHRREAIVVRSGVCLFPRGGGHRPSAGGGRELGEAWVLQTGPRQERGRTGAVKELRGGARCWKIDEEGRIRLTKDPDLVARARLARFAERDGEGWRVSQTSIATARARGLAPGTIVGWMREHADGSVPPPLVAAIHNWCGAAEKAFLGELCVLQVQSERAQQAVVGCAEINPWILAHPSPDLFVVRPGHRADLDAWLVCRGFATTGEFRGTPRLPPCGPSA